MTPGGENHLLNWVDILTKVLSKWMNIWFSVVFRQPHSNVYYKFLLALLCSLLSSLPCAPPSPSARICQPWRGAAVSFCACQCVRPVVLYEGWTMAKRWGGKILVHNGRGWVDLTDGRHLRRIVILLLPRERGRRRRCEWCWPPSDLGWPYWCQ